MAEARLAEIDQIDEFGQIMQHISNGNDFLLSGGAGSGKTFSLVQVIRRAIEDHPTSKIACMTYTNAAVKEIEERVNHKNLIVSTIHDFLWDNIKHFQKELKTTIIALANYENVARIRIDDANPLPADYYDNREEPCAIQYKEYLRLKEGIISHDELLLVAGYMFKHYLKLCDILKDRYKFFFVDEYQDTHEEVVRILLVHLKQTNKKSIVGFFGDAMQAIYDDGVGNIDDYKGPEDNRVKEVKKEQNRRNPQKVIDLANKLRTDGIEQKPSDDITAPNMTDGHVKGGNTSFLYSVNDDISVVKNYLTDTYGWPFDDSKRTKELNLTHNLIADKAGFRTLMDIYDKDLILAFKKRIRDYIKDNGINRDFSDSTFGEVIEILQAGKEGRELRRVLPTNAMQNFINDNPLLYQEALAYSWPVFSRIYVDTDQLIDDKKQDEEDENKKGSKRDNLIKHLFKIQSNISLYKDGKYHEFLKVTDYGRLHTIEDKRVLKNNIESLVEVGDKTIEEIIDDAHNKRICVKDEKLEKFQQDYRYVYNRVKEVKYSEFQKLFEYLEGKTPFSTQHKTKGDEFDNVLVILDNGNWNNYNFNNLFLGTGNPRVLERTQKIFYVCCTRAKENLAVFYHNPSDDVINKAKEWFGTQNVIQL